MLAMFKMREEVHAVIPLDGCDVIAAEDNAAEFLLRIPGEGDYSFIADSMTERDDWM